MENKQIYFCACAISSLLGQKLYKRKGFFPKILEKFFFSFSRHYNPGIKSEGTIWLIKTNKAAV